MPIFNTLFYIYIILTIFLYFKRKDLLSPGQIAFFFVILNIYLYLKGYSNFINIDNIDSSVRMLFVSIIIIFLFITIFTKKVNISLEDVQYRLKRPKLIIFLNIINIIFVFLENIIGSGTLIPTLHGIDIHTFSMPVISLYTRSIGFLLIFNYLHYINSKKKKFIILSILVVSLPIVTRSARMTSIVAIVQFMVFYILVNKQNIYNNFKRIAKLSAIVVLIMVLMTSITQYRMQNFNNYYGSYSSTIRYSGYEDRFGVFPMYYGYFVLGYENLNLSIQNIKSHQGIHTYGSYTLAPIFIGIFQFDNLFDDYPARTYANSFRVKIVSTATVPTGFYEFYLDFGDFAYISIMIYGIITLIYYNRIRRNAFYASYYSILAGAWAFMSFQNVLIEVATFYNIIFLYLFKKLLLEKNIVKLEEEK